MDGAIPSRGPRVSQYLTGDPKPSVNQTPAGARQLLFNRGGLQLYGGGTIPFMGDYVDVAPIPFVFNAVLGKWVFNGAIANATKASLQTFQAAWTDNRDAMIGKAQTEPLPSNPSITRYRYEMPLALNGSVSDARVSCSRRRQHALARRQRLHLADHAGFFVHCAIQQQTQRPGVIRSFVVQLTNNDELDPNGADAPTTYTLTIDPTARASFSRKSFSIAGPSCVDGPSAIVRDITVKVLPRSSVARTIYVPCGVTGPIAVTATDPSRRSRVGPDQRRSGQPGSEGTRWPTARPRIAQP